MCLLGNYPTAFGRESNRFSPSPSRGFVGGVRIAEILEDAHRLTADKSWLASFMCCAPAASGMPHHKNLALARPYTVTFSAGREREYSSECGERAFKSMMK
jgi:hypothetical protein